jgi:hypothetical protein
VNETRGGDVNALEAWRDFSGELKWSGSTDPVVEYADAAISELEEEVKRLRWMLDEVANTRRNRDAWNEWAAEYERRWAEREGG